jgi:lipoprotein NlpD
MNGRALMALTLAVMIAGCAAPRRPAPVVDRTPPAPRVSVPAPAPRAAPALAPTERADTYTVKRGETLYSIALDHGLDYRELAEWNGIADPNFIREDQVLRVRRPTDPVASVVQVSPITGPAPLQTRPLAAAPEIAKPAPGVKPDPIATKTEPKALRLPYSEENVALLAKPPAPRAQPAVAAPSAPAKAEPPAAAEPPSNNEPSPPGKAGESGVDWGWPAQGRVSSKFADPANKGVDIAGKIGDPVYAAASGVVRYVGTGIPSLGKLVIIIHNKMYLSAYAHNSELLVREGQAVVKGQKIGEMGKTGTDQPRLHFQIRREGTPVDPLKFLPEKPS